MNGRDVAEFLDAQLGGNFTRLYDASKQEEQQQIELGEQEKKKFANLVERMEKLNK